MHIDALLEKSRPFLAWVVDWHKQLERVSLDSLIDKAKQTAVLSVDVLDGFCYDGPLSSERVAGIVQPIVELFKAAQARGVPHFILTQDHHPADAVEFTHYSPHCVSGASEAETVPEFTALPFFDQFTIMHKNSISSSIATELDDWLEAHPEVTTFIVVGDCTDLCTYQLAMHLRLRANALQQREVRVILPTDSVQTYHLPVKVAQQIGAVPHDGDLLHLIFLYSMMLNGVEVIAGIES